jgi:hypothetical protein
MPLPYPRPFYESAVADKVLRKDRGECPKITLETRELILDMARANFLWGAPRIHGELVKLGITVSQSTWE